MKLLRWPHSLTCENVLGSVNDCDICWQQDEVELEHTCMGDRHFLARLLLQLLHLQKLQTRLKNRKPHCKSKSLMCCNIRCQAAYGELQQRCGALTSEVERLRTAASPGPASGPRSVEALSGGDASTRLRQMHEQLAQQELQLTSARAENQVRPPRSC